MGQTKPKVSAAALARLLGVSPAAVSYALHGRPGVSDELRRRILTAATEYGVPVPEDGSALDSAVLGLILADVLNPFYSELAISVTDAARGQGYEVFLSNSRDEERSVAAAVEAMIQHEVDGVLITAIQSGDAGVFRPLRAARIPFVQISRRSIHADADFVGIDDRAAGREIMEHVVGDGHRRIAIVAGPVSSTASKARADGFRSTLQAHGLPLERHWNLTGGLNEADGARAAHYLLDQRALPQAIVCGTDAIALGVIGVLATKGLMVPEDVAVTGFDGLTTARTHLVDLTTIVQPRTHMAAEAIALVTERRHHAQLAPRAITCPHHLYIGRSCGCRPRKEKQDV
ncbi:MAG: LacI family DNA-binding transcriptional regulator [Propionicimonas sp.]